MVMSWFRSTVKWLCVGLCVVSVCCSELGHDVAVFSPVLCADSIAYGVVSAWFIFGSRVAQVYYDVLRIGAGLVQVWIQAWLLGLVQVWCWFVYVLAHVNLYVVFID